jgi:hypothetical protein
MRVLIDGQEVADQSLGAGEFQLVAPAPPGVGQRRIDVVSSRVQPLPAPDTRQASALLRYIGFQPVQPPGAG